MPRSPRGATRRLAKRKPPLSVEALWAIRRIGTPTLSPDGALRLQRGDALRHGEERQQHVAVAVSDRPRHRAWRRVAARMLTAGDKDSDPKWSPDGKWIAFTAKRKDDEEPQLYLIAPDGGEARRLTRRRHRLRGAQMVRRRQAHRLHLLGVAGSRDRCAAGEAPEGAQGLEGQGARDRAPRIPLLGSLAHRRPRAARSRLRRRHRAMSRCARPHRRSRCRRGSRPPATTTSRPTAARSRSPPISAPSRG